MSVERKPYREIEFVAACLKRDGLAQEAEKLLAAHEGIFNGTELYMTWRQAIANILLLDSISDDTRVEVRRVYAIFDGALR